MPRNATIELYYLPLAAEAYAIAAAKEILGTGNKQPLEKLAIQIDQPLEPILVTFFLPTIKIKKEKATVTFFLEDVTGAAQIIQEGFAYNATAAEQVKGSSLIIQRRIIPAKDFTVEPELEGERKWTIQAEASAETAEVPVTTAKKVPFLKVDGIGRQ